MKKKKHHAKIGITERGLNGTDIDALQICLPWHGQRIRMKAEKLTIERKGTLYV